LVKNWIKRAFLQFGYQIVAVPKWSRSRVATDHSGYRLVDWNKDSRPDLDAYRVEQERGNRAKLHQVWTNEPNLRFLCDWVFEHGYRPKFVVCHGTRNGFEQRVLSSILDCEVIGTEISATAAEFPMTIHADFHDVRPEWDRKADIVYSNSLDHAYDPAQALRAWARSVRDRGFIVLDKASDSDPHGVSDLDPFGISLPNLLLFALDALGDIASVRAVIGVPQPKEGMTYHKMILIEIDRTRARAGTQ
jgi:SAM-dependent methyltransferase